MERTIRRLDALPPLDVVDPNGCANPEWLVTNGLGGYASATVSGAVTRRYHGLLVAALPAPLGRLVMLSALAEEIRFAGGNTLAINPQHTDGRKSQSFAALDGFRLESGLPVWRYRAGALTFEKRVYLPHRQNTVHITYRWLDAAEEFELWLGPLLQFREHEASVDTQPEDAYLLTVWEDQYEVAAGTLPPLRLLLHGKGDFVIERKKIERVAYPMEQRRGYESVGALWTPGSFHVRPAGPGEITFTASTESWDVIRALSPAQALAAEYERRLRLIEAAHPRARSGVAAELVLAADQFVVTPAGRLGDATRARAAGDDIRTVIAGYHWFTDWGRDTMIGLEGLTLTTGRSLEAAWILRTFGNAIRNGLIPNMFPERSRDGLYHTADATLWFFHAIDRYLEATGDRWTLRQLLPALIDIVQRHIAGTHFGIGVDPDDGLLRQGADGYQLTWMDAKVGDWVVTPRRGKAVEINALWYNALRLMQRWLREEDNGELSETLGRHAERAMASFNARFWCEAEGYLFDIVDGEKGSDSACRPNQLLAISLPHAVLEPARWSAVLDVVCRKLVTPVGLRTLAPGHPDYKPIYFGDLRARDAAYHQGTVWPWLIGPLVDAWLKVHAGDRAGARALLEGFVRELDQAGVGTIGEIFDAEPPQLPRGCIAQAWSVAEILRCWVKTAGEE